MKIIQRSTRVKNSLSEENLWKKKYWRLLNKESHPLHLLEKYRRKKAEEWIHSLPKPTTLNPPFLDKKGGGRRRREKQIRKKKEERHSNKRVPRGQINAYAESWAASLHPGEGGCLLTCPLILKKWGAAGARGGQGRGQNARG